jgi:predicted DCC family thiol-disulfide oxidoreductase YuxK
MSVRTDGTPARRSVPASDRPTVLFDGVCNLCHASVLFVIDRDPAGRFAFASLQSDTGRRLLAAHGRDAADLGTVVLVEDGRCFVRSTAALRIARRLSGAWPLLYLLIAVPRPIRDAVYAWVARNRYRWFGRSDACRIPSEDLASRFIGRERV